MQQIARFPAQKVGRVSEKQVVTFVIDMTVIRAAKNGDKESFAKLYDYFAPELYRTALFTLGNETDAEDVVSETFLEAFKGLHNLRDESSVRRWMLTILSARCKRRIAGYIQERKNADIDDMIDLPAPTHDGPDADHISVREALSFLRPDERQIVVLSAVMGYKTREIAQMLDLPHGTVSSKLYRSLKKLKETLE